MHFCVFFFLEHSALIIFCSTLKMLRKAMFFFFPLVMIHTIRLQPSCQGRCYGPAAGRSSRPLQNGVYFRCLAPARFHFGLSGRKCRYQVAFKSRCKQTFLKTLDIGNNGGLWHQELWCKSSLQRDLAQSSCTKAVLYVAADWHMCFAYFSKF